jgi:hypothetical protein
MIEVAAWIFDFGVSHPVPILQHFHVPAFAEDEQENKRPQNR